MIIAPISHDKAALKKAKELYERAFPVEERRTWEDILRLDERGDGKFRLRAIIKGGKQAGLITLWDFEKFLYIEHFAIEERLRGKGTGSRALRRIISRTSKPVVLEVEPPAGGEAAAGRVRFYQRLGFSPRTEQAYVQPPYAPGLPAVEMMLMSVGVLDAAEAASVLRRRVYGAD